MKRITVLLALTFGSFGVATAATLPVPCAVFGAGKCPNPVVEGVVDGQWIALVYHYNGTNGGPDSISVLTIGAGGNGYLTTDVQRIEPADDGDRMDAEFVGGKLWVKNAIYLPGQPHCCYTHVAVRQFGFQGRRLHVERTTTVPADATRGQIARALRTGMPGP